MSRLCLYPTASGRPCQQVVEDHHDHCESGHPCPPARYAPTRVDVSPGDGLSAEIDELLAPRTLRPSPPDEVEPDLPPWRLRTVGLAALGAAAADGALEAGGIHSPVMLGLLGLIGLASPIIAGVSKHRDERWQAREAAFTAKRELQREVQLAAVASSLEQMASQLEVISGSSGAASDQARGRLEAISLTAVAESLTEGSKVALYRVQSGALTPTLVGSGWRMRPRPIPVASDLGDAISELAESGGCLLLPGGSAGPDRVIAPVMAGNTLFGAVLAESADGSRFDDIDTQLIVGYSRLAGLGLSIGRSPFDEATPS